MDDVEVVVDLARQAAALLPEPPVPEDAFGFLAWQELVVSTAARLDVVSDARFPLPPQGRRSGAPLTWQTLLGLATLIDLRGQAAAEAAVTEIFCGRTVRDGAAATESAATVAPTSSLPVPGCSAPPVLDPPGRSRRDPLFAGACRSSGFRAPHGERPQR